ncbi:uncharacterized protein LOC115328189 isoform X1 [Ixodes scapularis]|nr:uncharacterized protein LOC115328189 isoform X1 [Ixodes scapularis]
MKSAVELRTMPHETLCDVYVCFEDIGLTSARLLFSSTRSFSSSSKCSLCTSLKHWSVLVCYDDLTFLCEATEVGGKLKSYLRLLPEKNQTMWERMTPKVHLGKYNLPKARLMEVMALLNENEDYNLFTNNCKHWTKKLLKELGIDLDNASFMKTPNFIDRCLHWLMDLESI